MQSERKNDAKRKEHDSGASWGFGEDAEEDEDDSEPESDEETDKKNKLPDYLRNVRLALQVIH